MERIEPAIDHYQTADGPRYRVQISRGGRRISQNFETLEQARQFRKAVRKEKREERERQPGITLDAYIQQTYSPWAETQVARGKMARSTLIGYSAAWNNHLRELKLDEGDDEPAFGELEIGELDVEHFTDAIDKLRAASIGEANILKVLTVCSAALTHAAGRPRSSDLKVNPMKALKWPEQVRARRVWVFTADTVECIRTELLVMHVGPAPARTSGLMLSVLYQLGVRPHEAIELQVRDVREDTVELEKTKTNRPRAVPLFETLREEIAAEVEHKSLGRADYLIRGNDGERWTEWDYRNWRSRNFNKAKVKVARKLDMPELIDSRPYDVGRHSFAGLHLAAHTERGRIAKFLGHTLQTFERNYAQQIPEYEGKPRLDPAETIRAAQASRGLSGGAAGPAAED